MEEGALTKGLGCKSPGAVVGQVWILGLVLWPVGISPLEPHWMLSLREKGFITKQGEGSGQSEERIRFLKVD